MRFLPQYTHTIEARRRGNNRLSQRTMLPMSPESREVRSLAIIGLVVAAALIAFFAVLEDVVTRDPLVRIDDALFQHLQSLRTIPLDRVVVAITELGDWVVTSSVITVVMLWLIWNRNGRTAGYLCAAVLVPSVFSFLLKFALRVERPIGPQSGWDIYSFPSGHATVNAALYGFLAVLLACEARSWRRKSIVTIATAFILSIAFSRLYLGAHFLSDVLAGVSFSTAWVALLSAAYLHRKPCTLGATGLSRLIVLTVVLAGGFHIYHRNALDIERYAVRTATLVATGTA
jgi:undecaprenyl-diphosphatase